MQLLLKIIRWLCGIILCLAALGGFANGDATMATIVLIVGILILPKTVSTILRFVSKKNSHPTDSPINQTTTPKLNKELKEELPPEVIKNVKAEVLAPNILFSSDDSIIDITGESYSLDTSNELKKHATVVPYWPHQYVYSFSELSRASKEQKNFYSLFKNSFLNGEYLDLDGNNNYAFILLFDLLNEYDNHKDLKKLESQMQFLGKWYPKTKSYTNSFLIQKMEAKGDTEGVLRIRLEDRYGYQNYETEYDWKLGSKYKAKLNLNDDEVKLLNILWYPSNNFCDIEFCRIEVLKLYLLAISAYKDICIEEGTTLDAQFLEVADVIAKKHFRYKAGSENYKYCIETTFKEIFSNIFKHCENTVREHYGHKRKINTDTYYQGEAKVEFETKVLAKVISLLPSLVTKISALDEPTEIQLYSQNTNRWKIKFEELTTNYNANSKQFVESIVALGKLNKNNPSIENIFFEASKFISKHDKEAALSLYVRYLYHDLESSTFDNKQLTKTIQKSLFKTDEQLRDFQSVVNELIKDKNLEKALQGVNKIYESKRKKIQLNVTAIKEVEQDHSGTVELLNEYLKDEHDEENSLIKASEVVEIEIAQKIDDVQAPLYIGGISFKPIHTSMLEMFAKSNFLVPQYELETFAKLKGVFKNQLIESINEICYENLDDVLIEEEEDYYTINPHYYQRLLADVR